MSRSFQKRPGEVFKEHSPNPQGGEDLDSDSEIAPIPIEAFDDVHRQKSQSTSDHFNTSFDGNTDQRFSGSSSQEPFAPAFSHKRSRIESEYKDGSNTTRTKAYSGKGFERSFDSSPHRDTRDMPHPSGPARRFAPAFSRKKQNPEAKFEERVAVPYSCLSSQKFDVTAGPVGPWNRFGLDKDNTGSSPTISSHDSTGNRKVEDLFVPVRDIMNERNIPKSLFEARNASVLVASGSTIVNKIGDSTLEWENKSDDRFKHMDEDGNYVDGTDRGRPKKRKMEERQMRLQERRDQVEHATTVMEDWERLSQEEKDKRYAIAKENHAIMMKSLEMEVCDEIPEMYLQTGKQKDLSVFVEGPEHSSGDEPLFVYSDDESVDDLQVTTDASRDEQSLITQRTANAENVSLPYRSPPAGTESFLPVGHQTRRLPGTGNLPLGGPSTLRPVAPKEPRPAGMESRLVGAGSPSAVADSRPVGPETEGSYQSKYTGDSLRDGIYGRTRATAKLKTNPKKRSSAPGYIIKSTYGSDPRQQTPTSMHLAPPSTPTPCIPRHPPPPTEQPPTRPDLRDSTYFAVKSWSEPTPFEDIPNHPSLHQRLGENKEKYQKIIHFAETQGRLVAVSLAPGVLFSGEAIVARVFGGAVQEFQFFPEKRQALILFLYPWDAASFLNHVNSALLESTHEYYRLQIAAGWYQDSEQKSIFKRHKYITRLVVFHGGSRVLRVDGIDKRIKRGPLLEAFKANFPNEMIIRCKLVVPKKRYEQVAANSNTAILEFASILHAFRAKAQLDSGSIPAFSSNPTRYLPDPVGAPVRQQWCICLHCAAEEGDASTVDGSVTSLETAQSNKTSFRGTNAGRGGVGRGTLGGRALALVWAQTRGPNGASYDEKADARPPEEFEERFEKAHKGPIVRMS